jgi:hypothetical protein
VGWKAAADQLRGIAGVARGWRLDAADETAVIEIGGVTAPRDSHAREFYAEEASFLGGAQFPSAGTWIVVGSTGRSWGCFLFSVPETR